MAKLYACSASIHVAPSGSGLPSTCSHVGRFADGVAAGAAAAPGAGRFVESLMFLYQITPPADYRSREPTPTERSRASPQPFILFCTGCSKSPVKSNWQVIRAGSIPWSQVSGGWRAGVAYLTMSAVRPLAKAPLQLFRPPTPMRPHDPQRPPPDPGSRVRPGSTGPLFAGGSACPLSHYPLPAAGFSGRD